jgi:hypothetical protein
VGPILECGTACWDPYGAGQINVLDRVLEKATKFVNHMSDSIWETLAQRRKISGSCALFEAYSGERTWKAIGDRLQGPCYMSLDEHDRKIRTRKQRTDVVRYSFVNTRRTIQL